MPNWCMNQLEIETVDDKDRQELYRFVRDCFTDEQLDFEKVIPYPEGAPSKEDIEMSDWYQTTGYDWCCQNWGTKWNATYFQPSFEYDNDSVFTVFYTAWGPPEGIHEKIKEMLPNCAISWFFQEDGMRISGWL